MKDSDDLHPRCLCSVEDAVGEARHHRFPNVSEYHSVQLWVRQDPIEYLLDPRDEVHPQARLLALVVIKGLIEFGLSLVAEDN
jgi:hypothetical protein